MSSHPTTYHYHMSTTGKKREGERRSRGGGVVRSTALNIHQGRRIRCTQGSARRERKKKLRTPISACNLSPQTPNQLTVTVSSSPFYSPLVTCSPSLCARALHACTRPPEQGGKHIDILSDGDERARYTCLFDAREPYMRTSYPPLITTHSSLDITSKSIFQHQTAPGQNNPRWRARQRRRVAVCETNVQTGIYHRAMGRFRLLIASS